MPRFLQMISGPIYSGCHWQLVCQCQILRSLLAIPILLCLAAASCSKKEEPRPAPEPARAQYEVTKTFGSGPVTFTVELSSATITTADPLKCRLTLSVAQGHEADFPDIAFPDDVPGSILTGYEEHTATEGDRRIVTRDLELEPEYEGKLTLPKLEIYSHPAGEVKEEILQTEPIEITVKATQETPADLELKPVRGLITVEQMAAQERHMWPSILAGAAALTIAIAAVVYLARRPRRLPPPPPAHETALKRLQAMADRGLETYAAEPFFVEVTQIVRDYIEQAFGVRAPEQTTDEFLTHMASSRVVAEHRQTLEPFLVAADEVKFACLRPDAAAMRKAFDTARTFVLESSAKKDELHTAELATAAGGRP